VEQLEERTVPSTLTPHDQLLFTPIDDEKPLAILADFTLIIGINNRGVKIPAGIGIHRGEELPIHTHDNGGTIDVESPVAAAFTLDDFFRVWGKTFNSQQILGFKTDAHHAIQMFVNGMPSTAFGSQPLTNGEAIFIHYVTLPPSHQTVAHHPPHHHHPHHHR
jgi:hypothetical protein